MFDPESEGLIDLKDLVPKNPADEVEREYRRLFDKRYKVQCFIGSDDRQTFQWLVSSFGRPKASLLLETFFRMNDQYFRDRAHGPGVLRKCINSVISKLPSDKPQETKSRTMILSLSVGCDQCHVEFTWVGPAKEIEGKKFCERCKK